ncbi:hypothetical protein ACFL3B_00660, partial [Gemmatimonadota bacterium]
MHAQQEDRVVKILTRVVSIVYFGAWVVAALVLIVAPLFRLIAPNLAADPTWRTGAPVTLPLTGDEVVSQWGVGQLGIELWDVTADLTLPMRLMPAWFLVVTWMAVAVMFGLVLLFLHQLRALFQSVRGGAP